MVRSLKADCWEEFRLALFVAVTRFGPLRKAPFNSFGRIDTAGFARWKLEGKASRLNIRTQNFTLRRTATLKDLEMRDGIVDVRYCDSGEPRLLWYPVSHLDDDGTAMV